MQNIFEDQTINAQFLYENGRLSVAFCDPSYVRSDLLVIDVQNRMAGVVLSEGYHHIGLLPDTVSLEALKTLEDVDLFATLSSGTEFKLTAPITVNQGEDNG